MPVFISYSHSDKEFAHHLAAQLVKHRARVWIDEWQLNVGDSIVGRIEEAIEGASALLVILSEASVKSAWCRQELDAGMLKELEEKRVVVLPVRVDQCKIPIFLRGKKYADFRHDFDKGLQEVLAAVSKVDNDSLGRIETPEWHVDWSIDWGEIDNSFAMQVTLVEQAKGAPYSCVTEVRLIASAKATARYYEFVKENLDWLERQKILEILADATAQQGLRILLTDNFPKTIIFEIGDKRRSLIYDVKVLARRLGEDTGKDILLDLAGQLDNIREVSSSVLQAASADDLAKAKKLGL